MPRPLNGILLTAIKEHGSLMSGDYHTLKALLKKKEHLIAVYWKDYLKCAVPVNTEKDYDGAIEDAATEVEFFALSEKFLPAYII